MQKAALKQQSAMEYLMTYGWSILIIAIVLAALFSLGVFGSSNLGPKAQTNSCRVYRPNGPGTTTNINLQGVCNGELPQYVGQFNGANGYVDAGNSATVNAGTSDFSISVWIYATGGSSYPTVVGKIGTGWTDPGWLIRFNAGGSTALVFYINNGMVNAPPATSTTLSFSQWYHVVGTRSGSIESLYVNGQLVSTNTASYVSGDLTSYADFKIGTGTGWGNFGGNIANVQFYKTALDANAVEALYLEGIGGAPIEPQYLAAWWPLNGDPNDYSGDNVNGAASNLAFTSTWTTGYTPP